jgi:tetratricopeptide (TPR) repeat protein
MIDKEDHAGAIQLFKRAIQLDPNFAMAYASLGLAYNEHSEKDSTSYYRMAYDLRDRVSDRERFYIEAHYHESVTGSLEKAGKWGVGSLDAESRTAAYYGHVKQSRDFLRQAITSGERVGEDQLPLLFEASAAGTEGLLGNPDVARREANEALAHTTGHDVQGMAALALALTGEVSRPQSLVDSLAKRFPQDTMVQFNYLPTIRAQLAVNRKDPAKAIEALKATVPYELGNMEGYNAMYVVFLRGEAYLMARQGSDAAAEFQKILDHRGIILNEVIGALAHVGLARAYVLQGDMERAKVAYQDFFSLWKDADSDVPVLRQAKAEFAKLH